MLMFSDSVWDMMSRRYKIRREHPATAAGARLEPRPKSTLANLRRIGHPILSSLRRASEALIAGALGHRDIFGTASRLLGTLVGDREVYPHEADDYS
jgi:hypothetical protein